MAVEHTDPEVTDPASKRHGGPMEQGEQGEQGGDADRATGGPAVSGPLDSDEVARFAALAAHWWDAEGPLKPLHKIGPARLRFIRNQLCAHFGRDPGAVRPLEGLHILDVGCGGGLVCEPLARLGATVTGIDPAAPSIEAARHHASESGLAIDYRPIDAAALVRTGEAFDAVLCLEVVEHVPDVPALLVDLGALTRPDGVLLLSTINRTVKAFLLAIVGAEYILRWLPRGTHRFDRFLTPEELECMLNAAGFSVRDRAGLSYNPLTDTWSLGEDLEVNYMLAATRSGR